MIEDSSVLVTGGSGSFGQAFVKNLLNNHKIRRIAIYSRGEHLQEEMERKFKDDRLRFFIGDVRDLDRLEMAMSGVDTVIHAAALKIVPTAEYNPTECVATNIRGAENVVKAALRSRVRRVVALSTDKAVNPINLYGATKLAAEKIFIAANSLAAGRCAFNVVRYGNVSGSRGSVLPLFQRLVSESKPITVTDERMTRFWITLPQSVQLVKNALWCCDIGMRGVVLVPKIPSIKIVDLAEIFAPGKDFKITGIRPGEKLHETLISEDEALKVSVETDENGDQFYIIHRFELAADQRALQKEYTSDNNDQWLDIPAIRKLIAS